MTRTTSHRVLAVATTVLLVAALAAIAGADGPVRTVRAMVSPAPAATAPSVGAGVPTDAAAPDDGPTASSSDEAPAAAGVAPDMAVDDAAQEAAEPGPVAPTAAVAGRPEPWSIGVHSGLGAWVDVWDWSLWGSSGKPQVTLETVDALAAQGVRTIYLQTTRIDKPDAVLEVDRLLGLVDRAHEHGMFVVGWYLPTFVDPADDLRRIEAAMALPLDGFALDIESQEVADPAERTRRLLAMSQRLRAVAGDRVLVANVLPPVQMEELAPSLWPGFPWAELGEYYEVFMPMGYFTFREDGHHWRDAEAYTAENVRRIRERVGDPDLPVHFIGGIADLTTVEDIQGMTRGAQASGAIGLSLYDVATTGTELWAPMQAWRELR